MTGHSKRPQVEPLRLTGRAQGAMLAAASGDALGWPVEPRGNRVGGTRGIEPRFAFMDWTRREGGRYAPHQRHIPAGTYSDDTQLMLAVARSLTLGEEWWEHFTGIELPIWTVYDLGGGGAVKRAATCWTRGRPPWVQPKPADLRKYFTAGANGVVMRILPHAIYGARDESFDQVGRRIVADGIATHGHPRALVGALAAGYAMWRAMRWRGKVGYGDLIDLCLDERKSWSDLPEIEEYAPEWAGQAAAALDREYAALWADVVEEMIGLLDTCREANRPWVSSP